MNVYRINKEPYHTDPLSVVGSYRHGGRWNPRGIGILYTSRTPELSLLETLVHLPPLTLSEIPSLWISTIRIPDDSETIFWLSPEKLPANWKNGTLTEIQWILSEWLLDPFCLALAVPSAVMNLSFNILLHPNHPAYQQVEVVQQRQFPLDARFINN